MTEDGADSRVSDRTWPNKRCSSSMGRWPNEKQFYCDKLLELEVCVLDSCQSTLIQHVYINNSTDQNTLEQFRMWKGEKLALASGLKE